MIRSPHVAVFSALGTWYLTRLASPVFAQSQPWSAIQGNLGGDRLCVAQGDVATLQGIGCLFINILSIALQGLGIVMFIMLLVGGLKYLTAGDDPKALEAAQGALTSAIVGLVMALLAWFILVAIDQFTGINRLTQFKFGL